MSEEEQEAIDFIRNYIVEYLIIKERLNKNGFDTEDCDDVKYNNYQVLLNLMQKQSKVIDLLIDDVYDNDNFWKLKCGFEKIEKGKEKEYIKEKFYRKVEEE